MARTNAGIEGQDFKLKTPRATYAAHLPLVGRHQLDNGATAILACEELLALRTDDSGAVTPAHVREGLAAVRWPARLEVLKRRPYVIVDGAHNGDSAKRIVATLRDDLHISRVVLLFGTLADKDAGAMADAVAPIVDQA